MAITSPGFAHLPYVYYSCIKDIPAYIVSGGSQVRWPYVCHNALLRSILLTKASDAEFGCFL